MTEEGSAGIVSGNRFTVQEIFALADDAACDIFEEVDEVGRDVRQGALDQGEAGYMSEMVSIRVSSVLYLPIQHITMVDDQGNAYSVVLTMN